MLPPYPATDVSEVFADKCVIQARAGPRGVGAVQACAGEGQGAYDREQEVGCEIDGIWLVLSARSYVGTTGQRRCYEQICEFTAYV